MRTTGEEVFAREKSEEELSKYMGQYEERAWSLWAAVTRDTREFVGHCGLMKWERPAAGPSGPDRRAASSAARVM